MSESDNNPLEPSHKAVPREQSQQTDAVDTDSDASKQSADTLSTAGNKTESDHGIKSLEDSMINRLGFLPDEDGELEQINGTTLYIVFSTGNVLFYVSLHHLMLVLLTTIPHYVDQTAGNFNTGNRIFSSFRQ